MKKITISVALLFTTLVLSAQQNSFGLLKFTIPGSWQEQSRQEVVAYEGTVPELNIPLEIRVYLNQNAGVKPDSSFKMQWQNIMTVYGNPAIPFVKKRYASSGLQVAINQATPVEINTGNGKQHTQLVVFMVEKQTQAIQFITTNLSDFKLLRPFIDDFIENVDTIAKRD
ncbi:MAG: hypothetical protein V4717_05770 [Bacteroidota bacterium]